MEYHITGTRDRKRQRKGMFDLGPDLDDVDLSVFNDIVETPGFDAITNTTHNGGLKTLNYFQPYFQSCLSHPCY